MFSILPKDLMDYVKIIEAETGRSKRSLNKDLMAIKNMITFYCDRQQFNNELRYILLIFIRNKIISDGSFAEGWPKGMDRGLWLTVDSFVNGLKKAGYSLSFQRCARNIVTVLLLSFEIHDLKISEEAVWKWFDYEKELYGDLWYSLRRSIIQYLLFLKTNTIQIENITPQREKMIDALPEWCKSTINTFLDLKEREGMVESTLVMYRSSIVRFCQYLVLIGITSFSDITTDIITSFNKQDKHATPEGKAAYNSRIRSFIIYLIDTGIVKNRFLLHAVPQSAAPKVRVASILSDDEVLKIIKTDINKLSSIELRDLTITCIGLFMGLRGIDIVNLKVTNINWKRRSISLIQRKTGMPITLPIPVYIGNLIFRYIRDARPRTTCDYIFVSHKLPYGQLSSPTCRSALLRFLKEKPKGQGFHLTRKTFATNLLRGNSKTSLICDALGHSTDETITHYLSLDEEQMRGCGLSLDELGLSWKAGIFDE